MANPGGQEGLGTLLQGYPEQSNVSIVEEFINLIVAQRAYEANSKVVKAADDMYQQVNNLSAMTRLLHRAAVVCVPRSRANPEVRGGGGRPHPGA